MWDSFATTPTILPWTRPSDGESDTGHPVWPGRPPGPMATLKALGVPRQYSLIFWEKIKVSFHCGIEPIPTAFKSLMRARKPKSFLVKKLFLPLVFCIIYLFLLSQAFLIFFFLLRPIHSIIQLIGVDQYTRWVSHSQRRGRRENMDDSFLQGLHFTREQWAWPLLLCLGWFGFPKGPHFSSG